MEGKLCLALALSFVTVLVFGRSVNEEGKHWAVLVAGSNGWYNYRHQADACHAYQIIKKNGIPEERIITMMYDDIAYNEKNPTPGRIINRPDGPDVYRGVKIDYSDKEVNPKNFLNVLRGKKEEMKGKGSEKVLKSGPNDHVFINFVDHGAPGLIAFPEKFLHAKELHKTIMEMHKNKMYKEMVIYVEACESGSMFVGDLLPKDINVFATTAANPNESSYACYMDKKRETFLGDVYSVKWMEDSDKGNMDTETLAKQFQIVKRETNTSHVQEYGDLRLGSIDVGEFQGKNHEHAVFDPEPLPNPLMDAVPSEDVEMNIAELRVRMAASDAERDEHLKELETIRQTREKTSKTFKNIVLLSVNEDAYMVYAVMSERQTLHSHDCYQAVVEHLKDTCTGLNIVQNDYGLRHLYMLVNLCELPTPTETIKKAIEKTAYETDLCDL